jgi:7-cyano-7-deazaguanine synthase
MNLDKVVVITSGGLDSATLLAREVKEKGVENVTALHFVFGQEKHRAAHRIKSYYEVTLRCADMRGHWPKFFHTGVIVSLAVQYAIEAGAGAIYLATNYDDEDIPDRDPIFNVHLANAVIEGTEGKVTLLMPFARDSKAVIIQHAADLLVPLELTHSCEHNYPHPCGYCHSCVDRLTAFALAGFEDPLKYNGNLRHRAILLDSLPSLKPKPFPGYAGKHDMDEKREEDLRLHG